MGKFVTTEVPAWRIVLWGAVAALAVLALGYCSSERIDYRLFILAAFVGLLFSGFGFFLLWSGRSGWAARHMRTLLVVYVVGQTLLLVWAILGPKK
jgi:hypothetical protein